MFITAFVVVHKLEGNRLLEAHHEHIDAVAKALISRYENGKPLPRNPRRALEKHRERPRPEHGRKEPLPPQFPIELEITADNHEVIYRHGFKRVRHSPTLTFTVTSDTSRSYTIVANRPILPYLFREIFTRVFSLQFIVILLVSSAVSAILSWSITRPLKKLSLSSRLIAQSETTTISNTLTGRGDELGELARDLQDMAQAIHATLAAQQQLLHDVSHELRAPLARLQARIALAEKGGLANEQAEPMHQDCQRINALIQQILDYSRLNRDVEKPKLTDINTLIEELITGLKIEFPDREIQFKPVDQHTPLLVSIYPEGIQSALDNIIRNACLHTPNNTLIEVTCIETADNVLIGIRDHGEGIDDAELDKVLQPFYRAGNNMHTSGFGLGLSIAQKALAKHKGNIRLTNHPEGGLQVQCFLPKRSH